jgi:dipeptidyl aminopeptidase/acylaminoacyl peptidase
MQYMSYKIRSLFLILIIFIACPAISQQEYRQPPAEIIELADAPQTPAYSISPDKKFIAFLERREYPPIQDIAKPELRLAGIRIDPSTNGISKPAYFTGITFMEISTGKEIDPAGLPDRLKIRHADWSPDSKHISFTLTRDSGIELWIIDLINFNASRLTSASLNEIMGKPYSWISNGNEILVKLVNPHRGLLPDKPPVPGGPVVQENTGKIAPARTYQDLLKNEF